MTPEQYWVSLTPSQQSYLKTLIMKKQVVMLGAGALVIAALAFYAGKKGLIKI